MTDTPALPLEGAGRCGYCNRRCVLQEDGRSWACPRCSPLLRTLYADTYDGAVLAYRRFQRDAARDRERP